MSINQDPFMEPIPVGVKNFDYVEQVIEENKRQSQRITSEENWRAGYDVSTEGALGDYPEECGW